MDEPRRDKVRRLLAETQSLPPEEREAFLRKRCEDPELRREVASLLEAQEEAAGFYEVLADSVVAPMLRGLDEADGDGPHSEESDPLGLEGEGVGSYLAQEHLGGGGMGIVYKARDPELGRAVALKFLPPHLSSSPEAEERFEREARAAAALEHPHIATIYEIGRAEGRRYIAMAFYEGETLKGELEREGPLPIEEAVRYAQQIAGALSAAHEASVVHRDVKPANVMITERGEVKLVDFGLARLADSPRLTGTGQQLGTVGYMSPEQVECREVGPAADLWALGAVLYEMLTGERPFEGERRAAVLHAVVNEAPTPAEEHRPEVPPGLARIVERCLQKDLAERYDSAEVLAEDLRALRAGESPAEPPPSSPHPSDEVLGRSRWTVAAAAMLLTVGLAALGWFFWPAGEAPAEAPGQAGRSVAVLPFEVSGAGAEEWRDGMVTMLSTGLDGAGGLRAIPDRTVFARWEEASEAKERATTEEVLSVARRTGARYAVVGSAGVLGKELRFSADVHEVSSGKRLGHALVRGSRDSITSLTDQLTRDVLGILLEKSEEQIPSVDLASITTESLEALKAYLAGERHLRAGAYEATVEDYERAVRRDSTFALAYARLDLSEAWAGISAQGGDLRRAFQLSNRLPRRERRLVRARYIGEVLDHPLAAADTLRRLTEEYPDDPSMWYFLGETVYHGWVPGGWPEAEKAFEEAARLDPGVAPYHDHLVGLSMSLHHDSALAARRIEAHRAGELKDWARALFDLNFGSDRDRHAARARIDTLPIRAGWWATALRHPTDLKLDAQVMRRVSGREDVNFDFSVRQALNSFERGRLSEFLSRIRGLEDTDSPTGCEVLAFGLTLGYPFPDSTLRRYIESLSPVQEIPPGKLFCTGIYLIEQSRGEEAGAVIHRLRSAAPEPSDLPVEPETDRYARSLEGYRAWARGNLGKAAKRWSGFNMSAPAGAIWRGDLYRKLGRLREAEGWYQGAWRHPVAHERLGQLYEEMGNPEKAVAAYEGFVTAWEEADPALQPRVEAARERLDALRKAAATE